MKTKKIFDTDAYVTQKEVTILECVKSERKGYEKYFEVITIIFSIKDSSWWKDQNKSIKGF